MSWTPIKPKAKRGGNARRIDYALRISRQGKRATTLCVTLPRDTMAALGWKIGDRVEFVINEETKMFGLVRKTDGTGYALTHNGGQRGNTGRHANVKVVLPMGTLNRVLGNEHAREFATINDMVVEPKDACFTANVVAVPLASSSHKAAQALDFDNLTALRAATKETQAQGIHQAPHPPKEVKKATAKPKDDFHPCLEVEACNGGVSIYGYDGDVLDEAVVYISETDIAGLVDELRAHIPK